MTFFRVLAPVARVGLVMNMRNGVASTEKFIPKVRAFSSAPLIFNVESNEDFAEKVLNSPVPVLVDFHAEWCGPCLTLGPRLEAKVEGRNGDVVMAKINVDYAGEIATDYDITAVPTVMSFKNGEIVGAFQGVIEDEQIDDFIEQVIQH